MAGERELLCSGDGLGFDLPASHPPDPDRLLLSQRRLQMTKIGLALILLGLFDLHTGLGLIALGGLFCLWGLPDDEDKPNTFYDQ